ncbi:hypothetical protein FIBSPDRAFT_1002366 [Athelia psychrophila]|uniref:F-box domain-containing protein n=1 Tax=Athelia psychrophila TaxID=1759441 RepID=A0A166Q9J8_9AGAM|nr:hypothetical protein FIBSPDRAFT_1002366 [Fibularhizoctonia sp. CBS 109695]
MEPPGHPPSLPTELWLKIIEQIPARRDVASLRAVSKRLCTISTPMSFHKITLEDTREGLNALREIIPALNISGSIQSLVLGVGCRLDPSSRWERGALRKVEIQLGFNACQVMHPNNIVGELIVINSFLNTPPPSPLEALTLFGLAVFPRFSIWSDSTATTLRSLTTLELNFHTVRDPDIISLFDRCIKGRGFAGPAQLVPLPARKAGNWKLTHLTMRVTQEAAFYRPCDLAETTFPNLVSLRIHKMVFRFPPDPTSPLHPGALEDFVARHARLRTLVLDDCAVQMSRNLQPHRTWAALCSRLAEALVDLVELSIYMHYPFAGQRDGRGEATQDPAEWPLGYAKVQLGWFGSDMFERSSFYSPAAVARDRAAVRALEQAVQDRAEARGL